MTTLHTDLALSLLLTSVAGLVALLQELEHGTCYFIGNGFRSTAVCAAACREDPWTCNVPEASTTIPLSPGAEDAVHRNRAGLDLRRCLADSRTPECSVENCCRNLLQDAVAWLAVLHTRPHATQSEVRRSNGMLVPQQTRPYVSLEGSSAIMRYRSCLVKSTKNLR